MNRLSIVENLSSATTLSSIRIELYVTFEVRMKTKRRVQKGVCWEVRFKGVQPLLDPTAELAETHPLSQLPPVHIVHCWFQSP